MTVPRESRREHRHPHTQELGGQAEDNLAAVSLRELLHARPTALNQQAQNQDEEHSSDDADNC